jgi:molybdopterin synthase sulfur carrier subunit
MRKLTNGQSVVELSGDTVAQVFEALESSYPGMQQQLYDDQGQLKRFIAVFVNGKDIRTLSQIETPVREQDEVYIVPAIAGGTHGSLSDMADTV